jgi:hypothetical protein
MRRVHMVIGGVALLLILVCVGPSETLTSSTLGRPCATGGSAFLGTDWFGGMLDMGASETDSLPFHIVPNPDFVYLRTAEYIASVALQQPYRAENDAYVRGLGYQVGEWPLVPLSGQVVSDYPGALEVYQTHLAFRTAAAAHDFLAGVIDPAPGTPVESEALASVGDEAYEFVVSGNPQAGTEADVGVQARINDTVVQIDLRGGTNVTGDYGSEVANAAGVLLKAVCRGQM